jgi:hypothetical protein
VLAMRWNLSSQEREPKEGAAGQLPNESSPEASDHPYRVQRHLRAKMMAVRVADGRHTWRLLGTSSLKEGAVLHV